MNKINNKLAMLLMALFAIMPFAMTSCTDDNKDGGQPVITAVRLCDPEKADSTFTKSPQGQTIAIIGQNLQNAVYVYINDQKVGFNSTMNTDHSIIVRVPSETDGFKLTPFNSDLKDEIRVETTHGVATYAFKIVGGYPSISRVQCEYPRKAGDVLNVYGLNLESIEKVYFTNILPDSLNHIEDLTSPVGDDIVEAKDFQTLVADHHLNTKTNVYETTSQLAVNIPEMPFDKGSFVVQCAAGTTYIAYGKTPGQPVIRSISSDMPVIGEVVTLSGTEFVQVESVKYGDVTLEANEFTVAETEDAITFTMDKVPSEGSAPVLSVTTPGGVGEYPFYDYSALLVDFDGHGADNGWDPNYTLESATYAGVPYTSTGNYARLKIEEIGPQWWGTMIFFRGNWDETGGCVPFSLPESIPASASANDVYLAMEVYDNNSEYNMGATGFSGYINYVIFPIGADTGADNQDDWTWTNFGWEDYDNKIWTNIHPVLADINDDVHKQKWYRHVVSLGNFPMYEGLTYGDIKAMGIDQLRIQSKNQHTTPGTVDICVDNIRLVYLPK